MFRFHFHDYSVYELEKCGNEFVKFLLKHQNDFFGLEGVEWTEVVLDWFAATARKEILVDAHPPKDAITNELQNLRKAVGGARNTHSEFLVDLCHSDFPSYSTLAFYSRAYWALALNSPRCIQLALESEWGKSNNKQANYAFIMEDATKLAVVRAKCKILVFATTDRACCDEVTESVKLLRKQMVDDSPWLLIDAARSDWGEGKIQPSFVVLQDER